MTVIGLTGGSGAGKTVALRVLVGMGAEAIDCDAVYHDLLEADGPMLEALKNRFPDATVAGRLERKTLGKIVFSDPVALAELNQITHKYVRQEVTRKLQLRKESGCHLAAIEAIALIESGIAKQCDKVVGILAEKEVRIRRIIAREGLTHAYASARIQSQKPDDFFKEHCDYILENNGENPASFAASCRTVFAKIKMRG